MTTMNNSMQVAFAVAGIKPKRPPVTPANPSRSATARVKNPLPVPTECRLCGGKVECVNNREIYGRSYGEWPWVYRCCDCGAYVGLHPFTALPLGSLADAATRAARKQAKALFQPIWEGGSMTRTEAYAWLAARLGIPFAACHFGWFDTETCNRVIEIIRKEQMS